MNYGLKNCFEKFASYVLRIGGGADIFLTIADAETTTADTNGLSKVFLVQGLTKKFSFKSFQFRVDARNKICEALKPVASDRVTDL